MGILVYSKCLSSNRQERCSTSEINNFTSMASSRTASCERLPRDYNPQNWNPYSIISCLSGWI